MKNKILALLLVFIGLVFGFFQERVKIETNFILEQAVHVQGYAQMAVSDRMTALQVYRIDHPFDYYFNHEPIEALMRLDIKQLTLLKWFSALIFLVINATIVVIAFKLWTGTKKLTRSIVVAYLAFLLLAVAVYGVARLAGHAAEGYGFARKILGALQSPVPLMILIPAYSLLTKHTQNEN